MFCERENAAVDLFLREFRRNAVERFVFGLAEGEACQNKRSFADIRETDFAVANGGLTEVGIDFRDVFVRFLFLRMGNALFAIPCCIVLLVDGLMGLIKLAVLRTVKAKHFMENLRTPIHDHFRKNKGSSNQQVRFGFNLAQILVSFVFLTILLLVNGR